MLIEADKSALLIIDVQEKLIRHIHNQQQVIDNCRWLMQIAARFEIPTLLSEQYPKGIGPTTPELQELADSSQVMEKVRFSCVAEPGCRDKLDTLDRPQIIIAGVEAHVCVLQTALELNDAGSQVFVVADAVGSRDPRNAELALARMRFEGVRIVSREMVAFEWLHQAGTDRFREISKEFLR